MAKKTYTHKFDIDEFEKQQLKFIKENIKYWTLQLKIKKAFKKMQSVTIATK